MFCTYFAQNVELTQEREEHIALKHSTLLPKYRHLLDDVLLNPDLIRLSSRTPKAFEFSRWYDEVLGGKHVVVIVVRDPERLWIITAYMASELSGGTVIWKLGA